jgi:hypothetical protein
VNRQVGLGANKAPDASGEDKRAWDAITVNELTVTAS